LAQKVFISHKDSDSVIAKRIAERVKAHGLGVYDVDLYCKTSRTSQSSQRLVENYSGISTASQKKFSNSFHKDLRAALGQT